MKKPEIKQIKYNYYGQQNAPKEYWNTISTIASFIGAALEGEICYNPSYDTSHVLNNSIYVSQTKEKFGNVVVYCTLAEDSRAEMLWQKSKDFEPDSPVPDNFSYKCLINDAIHYRAVYENAFLVWPQYYTAIKNWADYKGLLCASKEDFQDLVKSGYHVGTGGFDIENEKHLEDLYMVCGFQK